MALISTHPKELDGFLSFTVTTKLPPVILGPNITGKYGGLWSANPNGFVQEGALYTDNVVAASMTGGAATISFELLNTNFHRARLYSAYLYLLIFQFSYL